MSIFLDLFPAIIFFIFYKYYDIYTAIYALIIGVAVQNIVYWLKHKKVNNMHLFTLVITVLFGGATILLRDELFLKWKPTIIYIIFALALFIYPLFKKESLIQKMMGSQLTLPQVVWNKLNLAWVIFFIIMALLNLYIAFYYGKDIYDEDTRRDIWVNFKVWYSTILLFIFTAGQMFFIYKYMPDEDKKRIEK